MKTIVPETWAETITANLNDPTLWANYDEEAGRNRRKSEKKAALVSSDNLENVARAIFQERDRYAQSSPGSHEC